MCQNMILVHVRGGIPTSMINAIICVFEYLKDLEIF